MKLIKKLFNLSNKNIIIAGGAGQIGFAFVEILLDAGATIIIADIDDEMAKEKCAVSAIIKENKERLFIKKLDVSNTNAIEIFYKEITNEFGKLYGLVNVFHFKGNTRNLDTGSSFFAGFDAYPE